MSGHSKFSNIKHKRVEADLKAQKVAAKDIKLYIKPQDGACYYVADGKVAGRVDLF